MASKVNSSMFSRLFVIVTALGVSAVHADTIFVDDDEECFPINCCVLHTYPGCQDSGCQASVCAVDPFCCDVAWDQGCVTAARELCAICFGGSGTESDPFCLIQEAIDSAGDGDEIVVAPGTYIESVNFLGKAITLRSADGPEVTLIDGTGHVVECTSGEGPDTVLDGFTLTGGNASGGAYPDSLGGGMLNIDSSPMVTNCTFSGNNSNGPGGGMYNHNSSPTVTDCTFIGNSAGSSGGGMYNDNSCPMVIDCTFIGNSAAVYGGSGGGMRNWFSTPVVANCTFIGNTAGLVGGGMSNAYSNPTVTKCAFTGNVAGILGGGMYSSRSSPTVINCTFTGNTAVFDGGGMFIAASSPTVIDCTFNMNTATNGHALAFDSYQQSIPSDLIMNNCILWDGGSGVWNNDGSSVNINYSNVQGGWPGTGNIDTDPQFVDPDNGDFRLSPASPCIDAGDNTVTDVDCGDCDQPDPDGLPGCSDSACEQLVCSLNPSCCDTMWSLFCANKALTSCHCTAIPEITTDLDGNPRFLDVPETPDTGNGTLPIVDMGAYESLGGGCLAITTQEIVCHADGTTFTVNIEGLNNCTGGTTQVTFTASGGAVGQELCFTALVNDGGFCCSTEICVTIPDCTPDCDLNGDGIVGIVDFMALIGAWGSCSDCGTCPADFDGDCSVGILDLLILVANWTA